MQIHIQCLRYCDSAALCAVACLVVTTAARGAEPAGRLPNIVFIMADDLGYGELGCYGQGVIDTPRLDRLADEGMRFTQFYAGSTVCAPSRCVLMTGLHTGHARVRGNASAAIQSLRASDVTIARRLRDAGYATGMVGKWSLGAAVPGNEGLPNDQGFDYFFGYLNQTQAHNHYPEFLWRNTERVPLGNVVKRRTPDAPGGVATTKAAYAPDLMTDEAIGFVRRHRDEPFFLYWPMILPHANNEATRETGNGMEIPDEGAYADRPWPKPDRDYAATVAHMDANVGRLLDALAELGLAENTLVLFTSDNGPHREGGQDVERFDPAGPLRGMKRDLYEGGVRVPLIVRWPGKVPPDTVSDHVGYFGDVLATLADVASQPSPEATDSLSILPALTGQGDQPQHDYLYWEFYEEGGEQAVRAGDWKAVRTPMGTGRTELYNLGDDLGEAHDVAAEHPDVVRRLETLMDEAHVPDPNWKPRGRPR